MTSPQYRFKFFRLMTLLFLTLLLAACGGGGGGGSGNDPVQSNDSVTVLQKNTILVDGTTSPQIVSTVATENGRTQISFSVGELGNKLKVGNVLSIPPGIDSRYPLGFAGKIDELTPISGNIVAVLSSVTLADLLSESQTVEQEVPLSSDNFIGVIAPKAVQPTTQARAAKMAINPQSQKTGLDGGIVLTDSMVAQKATSFLGDNGSIDVGEIKLNVTVKLAEMGLDPATFSPYGGEAEANIAISGSLKNLKLIENHDFSVKDGLNSMRVKVVGNLTSEVKFSGGIKGNLGYYSQAWKEVEDAQLKLLGQSAKLTGLDSRDKIGKYPVAGLVFSVPCSSGCTIPSGSTQTPLRLAKNAGVIIWIYLTAEGEVTLDGAVGARVNGKLDMGLEKTEGGSLSVIKSLEAPAATRVIEAPFVEGYLDSKVKLGTSFEADFFYMV